jgi:hypothetical protein
MEAECCPPGVDLKVEQLDPMLQLVPAEVIDRSIFFGNHPALMLIRPIAPCYQRVNLITGVLKMQHSRMEMVSLAINPISGNDIKDELWRSRQMIRR